MKKMMRTAALALITAMMLAITAFAAPIVEETNGFEVQAAFDANGVKLTELTVLDDAIVEGGQYMIFVVDGDLPTADSILYVNQKEADEDGEITFENVYPKEMKPSNIMISGTGFAAPVIVAEIVEEAPDHIKGDIDGDGIHTASDATEILRKVVGLSSMIDESGLPMWVGDIDDDGVYTASDATEILRKVVGLSSMLDAQ